MCCGNIKCMLVIICKKEKQIWKNNKNLPELCIPTKTYLTAQTLRKVRNMFKFNREKTPEQSQWRRSGVFIVNFEHISHLFLVFFLLTLYIWNICWDSVIFTQYDFWDLLAIARERPFFCRFGDFLGSVTLGCIGSWLMIKKESLFHLTWLKWVFDNLFYKNDIHFFS